MDASDAIDFGQWVPLFPLPNAVLLPRAILPLHVFEARYCRMTEEALAGSRLIAMALLQPGYETTYHTLQAPMHDVVCVGRILKDERLSGGRFNILLLGLERATIRAENQEGPYRRGLLERLAPVSLNDVQEATSRKLLRKALTQSALQPMFETSRWLELVESSLFSLADMVDALASAVLWDVEDKQALLAEPRLDRRVRFLCDALHALAMVVCQSPPRAASPRIWPPVCREN